MLASRRAKALLHKYLTKEQRQELRGTQAFRVSDRDGRQYLITEGTAGNVYFLVGGEERYRLCVVARGHLPIPVYDLMLAQKLLIETDPEQFLKLANVTNINTFASFSSGEFLLAPNFIEPSRAEAARLLREAREAALAVLPPIEEADILEPEAWVQARINEAVQPPAAEGEAHV